MLLIPWIWEIGATRFRLDSADCTSGRVNGLTHANDVLRKVHVESTKRESLSNPQTEHGRKVAGDGRTVDGRVMTSPRPKKIMLAVLPFENLTGDPQKDYLADGLTEETISQLARLNPEQLGVIARTSVMGYKRKNERLDQIGRNLSVQYVLENSLRESGTHIRLTAQLIQVKDQTHL